MLLYIYNTVLYIFLADGRCEVRPAVHSCCQGLALDAIVKFSKQYEYTIKKHDMYVRAIYVCYI